MKKFLLLFFIALSFVYVNAETITYSCSSLGSSDINPLTTVSIENIITLSFSKGNNTSTTPAYYVSNKDIRLYAKNIMTVTASESYRITSIKFTISNVSQLANLSPSSGTMTISAADKKGIWTGDASIFTLTVNDKADLSNDSSKPGQFRFSAIEITYYKENVLEEYTLTLTAPDNVTLTSVRFTNLTEGEYTTTEDWHSLDNSLWLGESNIFTLTSNSEFSFKTIIITTSEYNPDIENDINTGIEEPSIESNITEYYNLQGIKINNPISGIYITNKGHKVIVK